MDEVLVSPYPEPPSPWIASYLFKTLPLRGDKPALVDASSHRLVSYRELFALICGKIESYHAAGLKAGDRLALHASYEPEYVAALIAAWNCDLTVIPLDVLLPAARKKQILDAAGASYISVTPLPECRLPFIPEETSTPAFVPDSEPECNHPAYIIFTSGSSGAPEGVALPHAGIAPVIHTQSLKFSVTPESVCLWYYPPSFDASLSDILVPLYSGATLVIPDRSQLKSIDYLLFILSEFRITHCDVPPACLSFIDPENLPPTLECIIIGGEACPGVQVKRHSKYRKVINVYGPTETTICSSIAVCSPADSEPSLGLPVHGMSYRLAPEGNDLFELHIGGKGVGKYLHRDCKGAFYRDNEDIWYRTGDLVALKGKNCFFRGRKDRQLQINGFRIEPAEIEAAVERTLPGIRNAVTVTRSPKKLVLHLESYRQLYTIKELQNLLKKELPQYMLPDAVKYHGELPLTRHGKTDLKVLERGVIEDSFPVRSFHGEFIVEAARALLSSNIDSSATFIENGGTSLQVMQLLLELGRAGIYITPEELYCQPLGSLLNTISNSEPHALTAAEVLAAAGLRALPSSFPPEFDFNGCEHPGRILLTGSTGFLGKYLVTYFLEQKIETVCLVRAKDDEAAKKRLCRHLLTDRLPEYLVAVAGDCALPHFGLNKERFNHFKDSINAIVHAATEINTLTPLSVRMPGQLKGLQNVLSLSSKRKIPVYYVSTLSVFVDTDRVHGEITGKSFFTECSRIYGGYAQQKWASEAFLIASSIKSELPLKLIRPGLLTAAGGSSDSLHRLEKAALFFIEKGAYPLDYEGLSVDFTPVDIAASLIVDAVVNPSSEPVLHIAHPEGITLKDIVSAIQEKGIKLTGYVSEAWQKLLSEQSEEIQHILCHTLPAKEYLSRRPFDIFARTGFSFKDTSAYQSIMPESKECARRLVKVVLERLQGGANVAA